MNSHLSYFGLDDPRISASDKDLPVLDILELQLFLNLTKQSLLLMIEGGGGTNTPDNIQVYTIIQRVGVY